MKGEPGVIDYLNKALRHELTADQPVLAALPPARELGLQGAGQAMAQGIDRGDAARRQARSSASSSSTAFPTCRCSTRCISART